MCDAKTLAVVAWTHEYLQGSPLGCFLSRSRPALLYLCSVLRKLLVKLADFIIKPARPSTQFAVQLMGRAAAS